MPVAKKPKNQSIQDYNMYDLIVMSQEDAGKVLHDECNKANPNIELIQNILEFSPVNVQGRLDYTTLMYASDSGHTEIVRMLLERPEILVNLQDEDGYTALMRASLNGHTEIENLIKSHRNFKETL